MTDHRTTLSAFLTCSTALAMPSAQAVVQQIASASTAVEGCQAALPAFEGLIRKRPLSVQNEGTSGAFVTCALASEAFVNKAEIFFNSIDGQDHIINCTAVVGYLGSARYLTRQVIAPASGAQAAIAILPADLNQQLNFGNNFVSWSCQLPAGTGVNDLSVYWQQDVGQ